MKVLLIAITVLLLSSCSGGGCKSLSFFKEAMKNQSEFQSEYNKLLLKEFPQYGDALKVNYEQQQLFSKKHLIEFTYMLKSHPEKLDIKNGLNGLMNLQKEDSVVKALNDNKEYSDLAQRMSDLEVEQEKYRAEYTKMRQDIGSSEAVDLRTQELSKVLMEKNSGLESKMSACAN